MRIGVVFNLILLGIFKYTNFFVQNINGILPADKAMNFEKIILPIGISFFTFQSISYLVDLYRGEVKVQKNIIKLSLYISLFPQLVAGPIVRYYDIAKDLTNRNHTLELFKSGVIRFVIGLSKKLLIANVMARLADEIMILPANELDAFTAWIGIIAYTLQIYFDFSGYSDMAIGLGRMFGFKFLENFNFPYISSSIQEFWRRWHISLSTWFRDYLYIPLGGNRLGVSRTYLNLGIVFFLTGLWHGASWSFVVWGLFHGTFLIIERLGFNQVLSKNKVLGHIYTLLVVMIAWVFFRIENIGDAIAYIQLMFTGNSNVNLNFMPTYEQWLFMGVGLFFSFNGVKLLKQFSYKYLQFETHPVTSELVKTTVIMFLFLYCIMALSSNAYNPFIYFRF
ncbi:MAG: MBOAT family O-acyltransferase [Salibacteraceae bacterium]